jgi:hypothetical protein
MRRIAAISLFLHAGFAAFSQTSIHYWDFNSGASTTIGMKWPSPVVAASTSNYGSITHAFDNTDNFTGAALDAPVSQAQPVTHFV